MKDARVEAIMDCLPQTQCEACDHQGCLPYAQAMAQGSDTIDHCAPGGIPVLQALAQQTAQDPTAYQDTVVEQYKPPSRVVIDPSQCIGCTKCIQVCPTSAIIGGPKAMHVIIESACTGCDLCLPVCPVDCMHPKPLDVNAPKHHSQYRSLWRHLHEHRKARTQAHQHRATQTHQHLKKSHKDQNTQQAMRMQAIREAMLREKSRRDET